MDQGDRPVPLAAGIRRGRLRERIGKQPGLSPEDRGPADEEDDRRGCQDRRYLRFTGRDIPSVLRGPAARGRTDAGHDSSNPVLITFNGPPGG